MLANKEDRHAEFICVSALFDPVSQKTLTGKGIWTGKLQFPARGISRGFGYDSIFVPEGYEKTIAELGETIKSRIGHRGKSIRALLGNNLPWTVK
jgi:XTP/dITP diphosphohydrolase